MLLNGLEFALMNNPVRAAIQRHVEAKRLLRMGGHTRGATVLELGCGRGVGTELIFEIFGAQSVDAFDLDPRMIARARRRFGLRNRARFFVGDATAIAAPDESYDAVFNFGIMHHVPDWRRVVAEVSRVLKPGGRFLGEEVLKPMIDNPISRLLFENPPEDRFDVADLTSVIRQNGMELIKTEDIWGVFAWFVARKPA